MSKGKNPNPNPNQEPLAPLAFGGDVGVASPVVNPSSPLPPLAPLGAKDNKKKKAAGDSRSSFVDNTNLSDIQKEALSKTTTKAEKKPSAENTVADNKAPTKAEKKPSVENTVARGKYRSRASSGTIWGSGLGIAAGIMFMLIPTPFTIVLGAALVATSIAYAVVKSPRKSYGASHEAAQQRAQDREPQKGEEVKQEQKQPERKPLEQKQPEQGVVEMTPPPGAPVVNPLVQQAQQSVGAPQGGDSNGNPTAAVVAQQSAAQQQPDINLTPPISTSLNGKGGTPSISDQSKSR